MADSSKKPNLTVLAGPQVGQRYEFDPVDNVLVGSDSSCGFCIDAPGVSPVHARIWMDPEGATVFDTRSPSGVYVNDERVKEKASLRHGDILWLGPPGGDASAMIQVSLPARDAPGAALATPSVELEAEPETVDIEEVEAFEVAPPDVDEPHTAAPAPAAFELVEAGDSSTGQAGVSGAALGGVAAAEAEPEPEVETVFLTADAGSPSHARLVVERVEEFVVDEPPPVAPIPAVAGVSVPAPEIKAPIEQRPSATLSAATAAFQPAVSSAAAPPAQAPAHTPVPVAAPVWADASVPAPAASSRTTSQLPSPAAVPPVPAAPAEAEGGEASEQGAEPAPGVPADAQRRRQLATPRPVPVGRRAEAAGRGVGLYVGLAAVVLVVAGAAAIYLLKPMPQAPAPAAQPVATTLPPPETVPAEPPAESPGTLPSTAEDTAASPGSLPEGPATPATATPPATAAAQPPSPAPPPAAAPAPRPAGAEARPAAAAQPRPAAVSSPAAPRPASPPGGRAAVPPPTTQGAAPATPAPAQPSAATHAQPQAAQATSLMTQAESALAARKPEQALALLDEVLKLDPQNAKAAGARPAAIAAVASLKKAFAVGKTSFIGKPKKGPAGFDDNEPADPDYQGRIEIEITPPRVQPGDALSMKVYLVNEGKKPIKLSSYTLTMIVNGQRSTSPASPQAKEAPPGQRMLVGDVPTSWGEGTVTWICDVTVTSARSESYATRVTWR